MIGARATALALALVVPAWACGGPAGEADRGPPPSSGAARPDVVLIVADDLDRDSVGAFGGPGGATPHIDALAARGVAFRRAHVAVSKCHPSRAALLTGLLPHRNGTVTAEPVREGVPLLPELLRDAGYFSGVIGKVSHTPRADDGAWDAVVPSPGLGRGRSPGRFGEAARAVLSEARAAGRPCFLMVNTHDPHRPFPGSADERSASGRGPFPPPSRVFDPAAVPVPGFLPDLPPVREELARYFAAVHRADETVGAVLEAVDASGRAGDTLVVFLSDNGMSFPFAKANVYPRSTLTPLVVAWPGRVRGGREDARSLVGAIDLVPTLLDLLGLGNDAASPFDGTSFAGALTDGGVAPRATLVTAYHGVDELTFPMRAIHFDRHVYIYNAWADGTTRFVSEAQSGLTMRAMLEAGQRDPAVKRRVDLYLHRRPEELYDAEADPDALEDLSADPAHAATLARGRRLLLDHLRESGDPLAARFADEPFGPGARR